MSKTVFITGASSGIGEGLAAEFSRRGCHLVLAARRMDRLDQLAQRLRRTGAGRILPLSMDVTDFPSIGRGIDRAVSELGRIDVLIANAGVAYSLPAGSGDFEKLRTTIDTDLTGAIATIELGLPHLRRQGGGQIVGITSVAGWRGMPKMGAYCAAKAGLHRYLQALKAEIRHEPIEVTELAPGYIDTDLNRDVPNRPFVIPLEKGAAIMAEMIEKKVGYRTVPVFPWALIAPLLKVVPTALLAPRRQKRGPGR